MAIDETLAKTLAGVQRDTIGENFLHFVGPGVVALLGLAGFDWTRSLIAGIAELQPAQGVAGGLLASIAVLLASSFAHQLFRMADSAVQGLHLYTPPHMRLVNQLIKADPAGNRKIHGLSSGRWRKTVWYFWYHSLSGDRPEVVRARLDWWVSTGLGTMASASLVGVALFVTGRCLSASGSWSRADVLYLVGLFVVGAVFTFTAAQARRRVDRLTYMITVLEQGKIRSLAASRRT